MTYDRGIPDFDRDMYALLVNMLDHQKDHLLERAIHGLHNKNKVAQMLAQHQLDDMFTWLGGCCDPGPDEEVVMSYLPRALDQIEMIKLHVPDLQLDFECIIRAIPQHELELRQRVANHA